MAQRARRVFYAKVAKGYVKICKVVSQTGMNLVYSANPIIVFRKFHAVRRRFLGKGREGFVKDRRGMYFLRKYTR